MASVGIASHMVVAVAVDVGKGKPSSPRMAPLMHDAAAAGCRECARGGVEVEASRCSIASIAAPTRVIRPTYATCDDEVCIISFISSFWSLFSQSQSQ